MLTAHGSFKDYAHKISKVTTIEVPYILSGGGHGGAYVPWTSQVGAPQAGDLRRDRLRNHNWQSGKTNARRSLEQDMRTSTEDYDQTQRTADRHARWWKHLWTTSTLMWCVKRFRGIQGEQIGRRYIFWEKSGMPRRTGDATWHLW